MFFHCINQYLTDGIKSKAKSSDPRHIFPFTYECACKGSKMFWALGYLMEAFFDSCSSSWLLQLGKHWRGYRSAAPTSDTGCTGQCRCQCVGAGSEFFFFFISRYVPIRVESDRIGRPTPTNSSLIGWYWLWFRPIQVKLKKRKKRKECKTWARGEEGWG